MRPNEQIDFDALRTPPEDRNGFGIGTGFRVLPYRMQDSYTRKKRPREFAAIVLENEHLKVTLLPEVGGKAWSIVDKATGREILENNPVFQPANLAIRNAWTSGGIEWNLPQLGHHCLTCSPVHAGRTQGPLGEGVRLWWFERMKRLTCQIDLRLHPDRPLLLVHVRVTNPGEHEQPMYWWTNIAVPEYEGGRVICPTDTAFKGREVVRVADDELTYPDRQKSAYDLFFRIPKGQRPWELFVDSAGQGLMHTSTGRLRGRKLFAWGVNPGSRHWNDFLSEPGRKYVEVQAGLCVTQSHTTPMPAGAVWDWTEAIGPASLPLPGPGPGSTSRHPGLGPGSTGWSTAVAAGEAFVASMLPTEEMDELHDVSAKEASEPPSEILFAGLGWAALEQERASALSQTSAIPASTPADAADMNEDQMPWLALVREGAYPEPDPAQGPGHFMTGIDWERLLLESIERGSGNWAAWFHLGVMQAEDLRADEARKSFRRSLRCRPTGWAEFALGMLAASENMADEATGHLASAREQLPHVPGIAAELGKLLDSRGRADELAGLVDDVLDQHKNEQFLVLECKSALDRGQLERAETILSREFAGVYEGDSRLCDLWWSLQMKKISRDEGITDESELLARVRATLDPPEWLDFRMTAGADKYAAPASKEKQQ